MKKTVLFVAIVVVLCSANVFADNNTDAERAEKYVGQDTIHYIHLSRVYTDILYQ